MSFQKSYLSFLKFWTKIQLSKYHPEIIGITGSAGKSSAVLATALVLLDKYPNQVQYTKKGNSETGIPYEILNIPVENYQGLGWFLPPLLALWNIITSWPSFKFLVVEMGIDSDQSPKNMEYQLSLIQPKIGALLNVSSVHGQNFSGPDAVQAIANEKRKLLTSLPSDGLAIYSADHPQILNGNPVIQATQKTFSSDQQESDCELLRYEVDLEGTCFTFRHDEKTLTLTFKNQLHTEAAFGSFATALLIGEKCGVSFEEAINALEKKFTLPPGRMNLLTGVNGTHLIDSSYNSSPEATASALNTLATLKTPGRKIAVLGDMRELGATTELDHQALADQATAAADILIWVGPLTKQYSYQYLFQKNTQKPNFSYENAWQVIEPLKALLQKDDVILIKGSQNTILLEIVVEALLSNPIDKDHLARRSNYWENHRQHLRK